VAFSYKRNVSSATLECFIFTASSHCCWSTLSPTCIPAVNRDHKTTNRFTLHSSSNAFIAAAQHSLVATHCCFCCTFCFLTVASNLVFWLDDCLLLIGHILFRSGAFLSIACRSLIQSERFAPHFFTEAFCQICLDRCSSRQLKPASES